MIERHRAKRIAVVYAKYFLVGTAVGLGAIALREGIAALLPADTPLFYALSVVVTYAVGILASFYGHRKITFGGVATARHLPMMVGWYTAIALFGFASTLVLSMALRYALPLDLMLPGYAGAVAFGIATFATSFATFGLNAAFTFGNKDKATRPL